MPNLNTFSTLHQKVLKFKADYDLETLSSAFSWLVLETILQLNSDEIEDALTDGSHDGGIDAIYLEGRTVHIFTFKYTDQFDNCNRSFPQNALDSLIVTMTGIFEKTLEQTSVNELVWEKVSEIWTQWAQGPLSFIYYACTNMQKPTLEACRRFESALNPTLFAEFIYIDLDEIVNKLLERRYRRSNGQLTFVDKQYFERSDGNIRGVVATIAATDLISLVTDPEDNDQINDSVFNDNIRLYKREHRINKGIIDTALSEQNYQFWYLNNGITIVCDQCIYTPNLRSPRVDLKNFQIVNGGQTTHALFDAYKSDPARVSDILLLVRICEAQREDPIADKISETTNSQIPVSTRDLHANDEIQKRLEEEFETLGYYYERKKNQYAERPAGIRLNNELLGQLWLAYHLDMPSEAKNSKSLVFGEKYDDIFDENKITATALLLPLQIYEPLQAMKREIQRRKRQKAPINEQDAYVSRATFHILNAVKLVAQHESLDLAIEQVRTSAIHSAIFLVGQVVAQVIIERGSLYTHDKFFKEIQTNSLIREHIQRFYTAGTTSS